MPVYTVQLRQETEHHIYTAERTGIMPEAPAETVVYRTITSALSSAASAEFECRSKGREGYLDVFEIRADWLFDVEKHTKRAGELRRPRAIKLMRDERGRSPMDVWMSDGQEEAEAAMREMQEDEA